MPFGAGDVAGPGNSVRPRGAEVQRLPRPRQGLGCAARRRRDRSPCARDPYGVGLGVRIWCTKSILAVVDGSDPAARGQRGVGSELRGGSVPLTMQTPPWLVTLSPGLVMTWRWGWSVPQVHTSNDPGKPASTAQGPLTHGNDKRAEIACADHRAVVQPSRGRQHAADGSGRASCCVCDRLTRGGGRWAQEGPQTIACRGIRW